MRARADHELPFFFGADHALFGVYHGVEHAAERAVLLCAPLGQEQIRCHRLYRQLAATLAAAGTPVLRFDYYGTGDAAGASGEVDIARCVADTHVAATALRTRSGAEDIVAFGARLGGSIAMLAASAAGFVDVMTWDPVVDGAAYVARMDAMQSALRVDTQRFTHPRSEHDVAGQWTGFDIGHGLREQLARVRIDAVDTPTVVFDASPDTHPLRATTDVTLVSLTPSAPWHDLSRMEMAVLSHPLIQAVSLHLKEPA